MLQLVTADFVRLVPKLPVWVPAQPIWACLVGVVLVAAGLAILSGRMARTAASIVGAMILVMVRRADPPVIGAYLAAACQSPRAAPVGSTMMLNQPIPGISVTSFTTWAPRDVAFAVDSFTSFTMT